MNATTDRTAAVMVEPVQGEAGVIIPDDDYLQRVREWCDSQGILLIWTRCRPAWAAWEACSDTRNTAWSRM